MKLFFGWVAAAALVAAGGALAREGDGAAQPEHKVACRDGTFADRSDANACAQHGGVGRARNSGPARTSQPPNARAHDTPAHASPYSAFGGKRSEVDEGRRRTTVTPDVRCKDGTLAHGGKDRASCTGHGGKAEGQEHEPGKGPGGDVKR